LSSAPFTSSEGSRVSAYDEAGEAYLAYADGDAKELFSFDGQYAYGDRRVWELLESLLISLIKSGQTHIKILDAGCGPGTWLRRVVMRARMLGYTSIEARGFDIAAGQVERARQLSANLASLPGVSLSFDVGDLTQPLPEADGSIDLCLCLYAVLNHLPIRAASRTLAEFARVTKGHFVATVRAAGSTPTIYIDSLERARDFSQDNRDDQCVVYLRDGKRVAFGSHLFTATEFRALIDDEFEVCDLCGLDLFHTRFAPDRRWNPPSAVADGRFDLELERLEEEYGRNPHFIDRASHLLVVGRPRHLAAEAAPDGQLNATSIVPKTGERIYPVLKNPRASIW
jgi:SAM-dependent methyltransferase